MNATTKIHSPPGGGGGDGLLHTLASALYERLACGHDALAYHVDPNGAALTILDENGKRRAVRGGGGEDTPPWRRARELRDVRAVPAAERPSGARVWVREGALQRRAGAGAGQGASESGEWVCLEMGLEAARRLCIAEARLFVEVDRRFNPWVLANHLRGSYSIAFAAAGFVSWAALDIDAHPRAGESVRDARARATRALAAVWRALGCSAARHPIVLRSPGGGYHVWFPLTRGETSANPEHTWPAAVVNAWFTRHLLAAGVELGAGDVEVFPAGRVLRAPCGRGMVLLQATHADVPDDLGLVPWPGTMGADRVDWRGASGELATPVRKVVPMVRTLLAQWDAQRRTLADWLGRPEASWDPTWGPLGWRNRDADVPIPESSDVAPAVESASSEKKSSEVRGGTSGRSQESDDDRGEHPRGVRGGVVGQGDRAGRSRQRGGDRRSGSPSFPNRSNPPAAPEPDQPPELAGGPLVRGRAFHRKVAELLAHGVTRPSSRYDAIKVLVFYWSATYGQDGGTVLANVERWLGAHPHTGSQLAGDRRALIADSLREARAYLAYGEGGWRRGAGGAGGMGTLTPPDQAVIAAVDPRVAGEVTAILAWLAGRAGDDGQIAEPVQIASGLLARLCGDRRVVEGEQRRRAAHLAIAELERIGVLTLASGYVVGRRGRLFSCWYRFGSGELPRAIELARATWDEAAPSWERGSAASTPAPASAVADVLVPEAALAIAEAAKTRSAAPQAARVVVRVVGERMLREGLLRLVSDGTRARPRAVLELAADARPTATAAPRAPWFVRPYRGRVITPADLAALPTEGLAKVIPFPDVEERRRRALDEHEREIAARRRMSRRERLALGTGELAPVVALAPRPARPAVAASVERAAPPASAGARAELAAEVGAVAFELPLDVAEVAALAWRSFGRRT